MNAYRNLIVMAVAAVASAAMAALADGTISQVEAVNLILAGLGTATVYLAPTLPQARYVKWGIAGLTAAATALVTVLGVHGVQHLTLTEVVQVLLAGVGALTVAAFPNTPEPAPARTALR